MEAQDIEEALRAHGAGRRGWIGYALVTLALVGAQAAFSLHSTRILRYEEVAESVRGPFWLAHRAVYDGVSTNLGWYGLLLAVYRVAGFTVDTAKWVRLALHAGSLACLAVVLARVLRRPWRAAVPLLAVGLSPSLLFFNTVETTYGLDLVYLPYLLALLALLPVAGEGRARLLADAAARAAFGALAMIAWMSYPVVLFYLPALAVAYLARSPRGPEETAPGGGRRGLPGLTLGTVAPALAGFLLPLAVALAWVRRPARLLYDPASGSGLFRGGGTGFVLDPRAVALNLLRTLRDLFVRGSSYYFWLDHAELSGPIGIAVFAAVAAGGVVLFRRRRELRPLLLAAVLVAAADLVVVSAGAGPQGLRRATALLAGFYLLYTLIWREATGGALGAGRSGLGRLRWTAAAFCLLLPFHHLAADVLDWPGLPLAGVEQTHLWLRVEPSAHESLAYWLERTAAGRPLDCRELALEPERCQYGGIFALLSGYRRWNGLPRVPLQGWDYGRGAFVPLTVESLAGEFDRRGSTSRAVNSGRPAASVTSSRRTIR